MEQASRFKLAHTLKQSTRLGQCEGILHVKHDKLADGSASKSRKWRSVFCRLRGFVLTLHHSVKDDALSEAPYYLLSGGASEEAHKRGQVLRLKTRQGELLVQGDKKTHPDWRVHLMSAYPTLLDCCHYINSDAKEALDAFITRGDSANVPTSAARLPIALLGLSGGGKTTVQQALTVKAHLLDETPGATTAPTEPTTLYWSPYFCFEIRDVGGHDPSQWLSLYSPAPHAILYVVDSCNRSELEPAAAKLRELMAMDALRHTLFCVVANKQGFMEPGVVEPAEILRIMGLDGPVPRSMAFVTTNTRIRAGVLDALSFVAGSVPLQI